MISWLHFDLCVRGEQFYSKGTGKITKKKQIMKNNPTKDIL